MKQSTWMKYSLLGLSAIWMSGCFKYTESEPDKETPDGESNTLPFTPSVPQEVAPPTHEQGEVGIPPAPLGALSELPVETEARPLSGGTLVASPDSRHAVASDSAGDTVYLVDLEARSVLSSTTFSGGAPGPVAADDESAFSLLQDAGKIVAFSWDSPENSKSAAVCASPEGLALDGDSVHVTCRGGQLVTLSRKDLSEQRRVWLDMDLRDVVVKGDHLIVSRLRTAELLVVDAEGGIQQRLKVLDRVASEAGVMWKMRMAPDGRLLLAHELLKNDVILDDEPNGYGQDGQCGTLAAPAVSVLELGEDGEDGAPFRVASVRQSILPRSAGTMDVVAQGALVFAAVPGNALADRGFAAVMSKEMDDTTDCGVPVDGLRVPEVPIAVASVKQQEVPDILVQTLEPGTLKFLREGSSIELHDAPRLDSGMRLFHMTVGDGVACSSCHPVGRTDAHAWNFASVGIRRTQSIEGGVSHLGNHHWDGEFETMGELLDDVMTRRMGLGMPVPDAHKEALLSFVDRIPTARGEYLYDEEAAARGKELFFDSAQQCAVCHKGPDFTNNVIYDVGTGGEFVTPSLVGVSQRLPIMHDGCAKDLKARFGVCGGGDEHGKTSHLSESQIDDLVAYLQTL